jgi:hypothetical protein
MQKPIVAAHFVSEVALLQGHFVGGDHLSGKVSGAFQVAGVAKFVVGVVSFHRFAFGSTGMLVMAIATWDHEFNKLPFS